MSRSNGGEGQEANPKVCASIIGAPQTVTHFSLSLSPVCLLALHAALQTQAASSWIVVRAMELVWYVDRYPGPPSPAMGLGGGVQDISTAHQRFTAWQTHGDRETHSLQGAHA